MSIRNYTELSRLKTFEERFKYLRLDGSVGEDTFGFDRYLNQSFYKSQDWRKVRDYVILRDLGSDLGIEEVPINGRIIIHHMNPITKLDLVDNTDYVLNPEYLICVSHDTHNAIHYGIDNLVKNEIVEREPNDTCPWRR